MRYFECPTYVDPIEFARRRSILLGGGISGCPDWQSEMVKMLSGEDLNILNPRRSKFPINDPGAGEKQIDWEITYLEGVVNPLLLWFPWESIAPIALLEFGRYLDRKPIFVGVHPEYPRRVDIEVRVKLIRPSIQIAYTLEDLAQQVINRYKPVDLDTPITQLEGWTKRTEDFLTEWSLEGVAKTVGDWLDILYSYEFGRLTGSYKKEAVTEISRRLKMDMGGLKAFRSLST